MRFASTGGKSPPVSPSRAVVENSAPDGGLYIPETIPSLPAGFFDHVQGLSFRRIGEELLGRFFDDLPPDVLATILGRAWTFPVPLTKLDSGLYLIELFHGPTLAFKDIGARFMAGLLSHAASRGERMIVVATSGDTGSAVASAFAGLPGMRVVILYPGGRISRLQEHQMATHGGNVTAFRVDGSFDDCQSLARQALADPELRSRRGLASANSINPARLLPQVAHFIWAYAQWRAGGGATEPDIIVPSGNFGNITAAAYARAMGVPFRTLVAATNANDVVPRYLASGKYEPRRARMTLSNAMDVGNPSNLARLEALYRFDLARMRECVAAVSIGDDETLAEIRLTYERTGIIVDPHTAVAVAAARRREDPSHPAIIAATAHPAKFPETIRRALGIDIPLPPPLADALSKPLLSIPISPDYPALQRILV